MTSAVARSAVAFVAALLSVTLLAACGTAETGIQGDAARQLQERVLKVSEASAANDRDAALKALDVLAVDLESTAIQGKISEGRRRQIATVIAAVRADLTGPQVAVQSGAVEPTKAEAPQAGPEAEPHTQDAPVAPAPVAVPAPPAAPAPAFLDPGPAPAAPAPVSSARAKNNNGKGNGNGSGSDAKTKGRDN